MIVRVRVWHVYLLAILAGIGLGVAFAGGTEIIYTHPVPTGTAIHGR